LPIGNLKKKKARVWKGQRPTRGGECGAEGGCGERSWPGKLSSGSRRVKKLIRAKGATRKKEDGGNRGSFRRPERKNVPGGTHRVRGKEKNALNGIKKEIRGWQHKRSPERFDLGSRGAQEPLSSERRKSQQDFHTEEKGRRGRQEEQTGDKWARMTLQKEKKRRIGVTTMGL